MSEEEDTIIIHPDIAFQKHGENWYQKSTKYWEKQESNDNGMLGGYPDVSKVDLLCSCKLIEKHQKVSKMGNSKAADCGAGIGRVVINCLSHYFSTCDLIDPVSKFLDEAEAKLGKYPIKKIVCGIQDWTPTDKFDCIWAQWSIMYLKDDDAIKFLMRCKASLAPNGLIFIKDNISCASRTAKKNTCLFFSEDNGLARSYTHYLELFTLAGLTLVESVKQMDYPASLLPLYTFVLK